jgi:hypothetical protein
MKHFSRHFVCRRQPCLKSRPAQSRSSHRILTPATVRLTATARLTATVRLSATVRLTAARRAVTRNVMLARHDVRSRLQKAPCLSPDAGKQPRRESPPYATPGVEFPDARDRRRDGATGTPPRRAGVAAPSWRRACATRARRRFARPRRPRAPDSTAHDRDATFTGASRLPVKVARASPLEGTGGEGAFSGERQSLSLPRKKMRS